MAMVASDMATDVVNALKPFNPRITGAVEVNLHTKWTAICGAIIDYMKGNLDVLPTSHGALALGFDVDGLIAEVTSGAGFPGNVSNATPNPIMGTGSVE